MYSCEKQPRETVQGEQKCASHLKYDRNSFNANVRNTQNSRDKVGPLDDNAVNIITQEI